MKKKFEYQERRGLPGGPNEMFTYTTGVFSTDTFSTEGYKRNSPDVNNPYNIIPSGNITMKDVDFPVHGVDNLGNEQMMMPGNDYQFPGDMVFETPMYKRGGGLLTKTMKCNSCGWSWKAADGGNDVTTCHKCGGEALPKAQDGEETKPWEPKPSIDPAMYVAAAKEFAANERKKQLTGAALEANKRNPQLSAIQQRDKDIETLKGSGINPARLAMKSEDQGSIDQYVEPEFEEQALNYLANPMTTLGYLARGEDLPNLVQDKDNPIDYAMDVINPFAWVDYGMKAVDEVSKGNYIDAGLNALGAIPSIPVGAKYLKSTLNLVPSSLKTLPKAKNFKDALGAFTGIPTERSLLRLSPEDLKIYRQVQEIARIRAKWQPISKQYKYALNQNIPDEHFEKIFGRTKAEVEQILPSVTEQETFRSSIPIRERFDLERPPRRTRRRSSDAAIDQMNSQLDIRTASPEQIQQFADRAGMSANELTRLAESTLPSQTRDRVIRNRLGDYGNELEFMIEDLFINTNNKVPISEVINNKLTNMISKYPYYKGPVLENVPSLSLKSSGTLKKVSDKVAGQSTSGVSSGDVFTGSLNTSHSSYLPQIKQIFKYTDGTPHFLGYKPMNHLGFLSDFKYSQDDIAKYLNTEIDQQISRGVIPKDILRPYVTKNRLMLPHYGIKQFQEGGDIDLQYAQGGVPKAQFGVEDLTIYKNYLEGVYNNTDDEEIGQKIYDKLNRVYYRQAKENNMSAPNYIMTNVIR